MDKQKTGELIKNARINKGYTQVELGDLLGVTNKAISRWEKGDSFPDIGVIEELSRILDIRIQDIVIGEIKEQNTDSETAVTEVVRVAKLQDRVKKREFITGIAAVILVAVFLKERLIGADPNRENVDKLIYNIIGFGSLAYSFIMMIIVTGIFNNHEIQSWKIEGNIGRIINVQLIIIFILNLALLIIQNYVNCENMKERLVGHTV